MPLPQATSVRDRTSEFLAVVERLQKQQGGPNSASSSHSDPKASIQQHTEFTRKASDIGYAIHRTSLKLQKLAKLAKKTSMFDDPTQEVDELTGMVKQDIQSLNTALVDLQRLSNSNNSNTKQSLDHSHTVVDNLRAKLKDATQEFKDVLTTRTENLKQHKERRQLFTSNDREETLPLINRPRPGQPGLSSSSMPTGPSFMQAQQQAQMLAQPQDTYLSSRAEALRNVESTIHELGGIFQKLSEMVAQQGELAIRIDENVEESLSNVNNAQAELLKLLSTVSQNRWLIMKVFGILMVFMIIFILFIA